MNAQAEMMHLCRFEKPAFVPINLINNQILFYQVEKILGTIVLLYQHTMRAIFFYFPNLASPKITLFYLAKAANWE